MKNRIEYWRNRRGLSMQELAERANTTASTINKLEKGGMQLTQAWMTRIAKELGVQSADLLLGPTKTDMTEDVEVYAPPAAHPLARLATLPNYRVYTMKTGVLEDLGIAKGDLVVVDSSTEAIENLAPLSAVLLNYWDDKELKRSKALARQFLPPDKFVSNSASDPQSEISISRERAEVAGVIVLHPPDLRSKRRM